MQLNYKDSLLDLYKYDKFLISAHGSIKINRQLFFRVPENTYIIYLTDQHNVSENYYKEIDKNFVDNSKLSYYIEKILLTPKGENIDDQYIKNKVIYTPGSCIINTTVSFYTNPDTVMVGIFKLPDEKSNFKI